MTDEPAPATDEELAARCLKVVTDTAAFMGITPQWHIAVVMDDLTHEGAPNSAGRVEWPVLYHKATIHFDRAHIRQCPDDILLEIVVHEMVHIMTAPADDMLKEEIGRTSYAYMRWCDTMEGVCDSIAHVILKAMGTGFDSVCSLEKTP